MTCFIYKCQCNRSATVIKKGQLLQMKKIQNTVYVIKKHDMSKKVGEYKSKQSDIKIYPRVMFLVETTEM